MGTARILTADGKEERGINQDARTLELLALLVLGREYLPPKGVRQGKEVLRDWLAANMFPTLFATERTRQAAREKIRYHRDKLQAALHIRPVDVRPVAGEDRRERSVVSVTWEEVWIDLLALREAAKHLHSPQKQEEVIALAGRPLLDQAAYAWLQEPDLQQVRTEFDTYFLTALYRRADSRIVQMEKANEAGRFADADTCRSDALPLLDKAAERLRGCAERLDHSQYAALLSFEPQFLELRRRADYSQSEEAARAAPVRHILRPVTAFFGREPEKQKIRSLLAAKRLVTLTGMGGCGKTRLALEVAADIETSEQAVVWLVELASLEEAALLAQTAAATLGLEVKKDCVSALIAYFQVQNKPTLLLLDNCEHIVEACAALVESLLQACPDLTVLATSRKSLNIDGEHRVPLQPLPFPPLNSLSAETPDAVNALLQYDSACLFLDRALQFRPFPLETGNVAAVAAICATLDGIPLALELAAARFKALSLEKIAEMLSDRFRFLTGGRPRSAARHKTLRAVIDWSFDLLSEPERALLCRLSVFEGGWTLDAAEAVGSSEDLPHADVLDLLEALADHSLIMCDLTDSPGRYQMLDTVRQYAQDRLREQGMLDTTMRQHRRFFLGLAEEAAPHLQGPEPAWWLDRLEMETANLRASLEGHSQETALRMACALTRFWLVRGSKQEVSQWLEQAARTEEKVSTDLRAKAMNCAGSLQFALGNFKESQRLHEAGLEFWQQITEEGGIAESLNSIGGAIAHQGDYAKAQPLIETSLALMRKRNDHSGIATCLSYGAMVANFQGEFDRANELLQESLTLLRETKDVRSIANCLHNLGIVALYQINYAAAQEYFEESLALWRPLGDKYSLAKSLNGLGEVALLQSKYEAAAIIYAESLELRRQSGDKYGFANSLNGLAEAASQQGDYQKARGLYEESLALRRQIGDAEGEAHSLHNLGEIELRQQNHSAARRLFLNSLRLMRQNKDQYGTAFSLECLASAASSLGEPLTAVRLWGAAESLRETTGFPLPANTQQEYQSKAAAVRTSLGDASFEAAWAEGQAMTWEQAVAYALGKAEA